jgi:hypothetical protein
MHVVLIKDIPNSEVMRVKRSSQALYSRNQGSLSLLALDPLVDLVRMVLKFVFSKGIKV